MEKVATPLFKKPFLEVSEKQDVQIIYCWFYAVESISLHDVP